VDIQRTLENVRRMIPMDQKVVSDRIWSNEGMKVRDVRLEGRDWVVDYTFQLNAHQEKIVATARLKRSRENRFFVTVATQSGLRNVHIEAQPAYSA
jgi:hypothetical protein